MRSVLFVPGASSHSGRCRWRLFSPLCLIVICALSVQAAASAGTFASVVAFPASILEGQDTIFIFSISQANPDRPTHIHYLPLYKSALLGQDFVLTGTPYVATIPPGATATTVTLHSFYIDGRQHPRVATLRIVDARHYQPTAPAQASVEIVDTDL